MQDWIETIYGHLESSSGYWYDKVVIQLTDNKEFKYPRITNQEFLAMAETGDILLFQGKSKGSALQRLITWSKYDHVAVVLKWMDDKVLIFESTGENGVDILDWNLFIEKGWPSLYHKIVYILWFTVGSFYQMLPKSYLVVWLTIQSYQLFTKLRKLRLLLAKMLLIGFLN